MPEALFNYAVAAERLHLNLTAQKAWENYLSVEADPQWRREAEQRLQELKEPTASERWRILERQLELGAAQDDKLAINEAERGFPQELRDWAQEKLLNKWAEACEAGASQEAGGFSHTVTSIGQLLADKRGEFSVINAATAIQKENCTGRNQLAGGHEAYAQGVLLYNQSRYIEASIPLRIAESAFEKTGSTAALLWTRLWLGGTEYYDRHHDQAEARFRAILKDPAIANFPALRGRALWCRGQLALVHADFDKALLFFNQARTLFEILGEMENAGALDALIADTLRRAGRYDESWSARFQALQRLSCYPGSHRLHNLLFEAPDALLSEGLVFAALEFQVEGSLVAERFSGKPSNIAASLLLGSRIRANWNIEDALSTLDHAQQFIRQIKDGELREAFWFESTVVEYEIYLRGSTKYEPAGIAKAIGYYEDLRQPINAAHARLLHARAEIRAGDLTQAEQDLEIGIGYQEAMAKNISDQASFAEEWQELFEEMIRLNAVLRQSPEKAFGFIERSRIPPCKTGADLPCIRVRDLDEIRKNVPKEFALLQYFILPERLLVWRFYNGVVRLWELPIDNERLQSQIESFVRDLEDGRDPRGAWVLYNLLLRGPLQDLPPATELIIVPDRVLNRVPFAALRDYKTKRYLIEDHALRYAPSTSRFLSTLNNSVPRADAPSSVTALSFGGLNISGRGAQLVHLPFADSEANGVAQFYAKRQIFTGNAATRTAFLAALRESEIVHFAGHGVLNIESPLLSGIVLAPDDATEDSSILSFCDIPSLRASRLRLLVLSACETSPGSRRRVDGIGGIAGALIARGVPAVISMQWKTDDAFSREFLLGFHATLAKGISASEALRVAQIKRIRVANSGPSNPTLWAGYRLTD
jgi:CHAT domain-containing protein